MSNLPYRSFSWRLIVPITLMLVMLISAGPRIAETLFRERANHVFLHALVLDNQKGDSCLGKPRLEVSNWIALAEAREQWQKMGDIWPESKSRFRQLGMLALAQGKRSEAAQNFVLADDPVSRFWLSRLVAEDGRYEEAGKYLSQEYPAGWQVLLQWATATSSQQDLTEPLVCYKIVVLWDDGNDPSILIARGLVGQILGQYPAALGDFDRAITLCPTCYQAYLYRGQTLLISGAGNLDSIEEDFLRAVTLAPDQRDAALQWGQWLIYRSRYPEAEVLFKKWAQRYPDDLESVANLAYIYCNTGRPNEGEFLLEEFSVNSPANAQINRDRIRQQLEQCQH